MLLLLLMLLMLTSTVNVNVNKYGYQYGCTLWVNKLGLEIIHLNKGQHWEKILGQE